MSRGRPPEEFEDSYADDDDDEMPPAPVSPADAKRDIRSASRPVLNGDWHLQSVWPKDTRTHVFLGNALDAYGRAMFGAEWRVSDLTALLTVALPEMITALHQQIYPALRAEEGRKCERVMAVLNAIHEEARDGVLQTAFRLVNSEECGDFFPVSQSFWNVDDIRRTRLSRASITHPIGSPPQESDVYIFFTAPSLAEALAQVEGRQPVAAETAATSISTPDSPDKQRRIENGPVRGYARKDLPLVEEMRKIVCEEGAMPWAAAIRLVARASGNGSQDAKLKRLVDRYKRTYPAEK